jgi:hypothetical protein
MRNKDSSSTPARQSHWLVRLVGFFRMWETVRFLDKQCLSLKLGNEQGHLLGHWNCEGDFLETVERARRRLKQSDNIQSNDQSSRT